MRSNVRVTFYRTEEGALFSYCKGVYAFHKDVSKPMQMDSAWVGLCPFTSTTSIRVVPLEELTPWEVEQHFLFWGVIPIDVEPSNTRRKVATMLELSEQEIRDREISADYYMQSLWASKHGLPQPEMPDVVKAAQARREAGVLANTVDPEEPTKKEAAMSAIEQLNKLTTALEQLVSVIPGVAASLREEVVMASPSPVVVAQAVPLEEPIVEKPPTELPVIEGFPKSFITDRNKTRNGVLTGVTELRGYVYDLVFYNEENGIATTYPADSLYGVDTTVVLAGLDAVMEALQGTEGKASDAGISKSQRENYNAYLRNLSNGLSYQLSVFKRVGFLNNPSLTQEYVAMAKQLKELITVVLTDLQEWRKAPTMGVPLDPKGAV